MFSETGQSRRSVSRARRAFNAPQRGMRKSNCRPCFGHSYRIGRDCRRTGEEAQFSAFPYFRYRENQSGELGPNEIKKLFERHGKHRAGSARYTRS